MSRQVVPQHKIDQHAAAMRDSGVPRAAQRLTASGIVATLEQFADQLEAVKATDVELSMVQIIEILRDMACGWTQIRDAL